MAMIVHSQEQADGSHRFRIWSNITYNYITGELSEEQLRLYLLAEAVRAALDELEMPVRGIDGRIERALAHGTSCLPTVPRSTKGPWDPNREPNESGPIDQNPAQFLAELITWLQDQLPSSP